MTISPRELRELSVAKLKALNALQRLVDELLIDRGSGIQPCSLRLDRATYDGALVTMLCLRYIAAGWADVTAVMRDGALELMFIPKSQEVVCNANGPSRTDPPD